MVTVLFFGPLAELTGRERLSINDCSNTNELQQHLLKQFPALAHRKFAIAVDKKLVQENSILEAGSEVALLPPFSGG